MILSRETMGRVLAACEQAHLSQTGAVDLSLAPDTLQALQALKGYAVRKLPGTPPDVYRVYSPSGWREWLWHVDKVRQWELDHND